MTRTVSCFVPQQLDHNRLMGGLGLEVEAGWGGAETWLGPETLAWIWGPGDPKERYNASEAAESLVWLQVSMNVPCCALVLSVSIGCIVVAEMILPLCQGRGRVPSFKCLCEACFGRTLNKTQQRSEWGKRPLTGSQLAYAALDAVALVRVHFVLLALAVEPSHAMPVFPGML